MGLELFVSDAGEEVRIRWDLALWRKRQVDALDVAKKGWAAMNQGKEMRFVAVGRQGLIELNVMLAVEMSISISEVRIVRI